MTKTDDEILNEFTRLVACEKSDKIQQATIRLYRLAEEQGRCDMQERWISISDKWQAKKEEEVKTAEQRGFEKKAEKERMRGYKQGWDDHDHNCNAKKREAYEKGRASVEARCSVCGVAESKEPPITYINKHCPDCLTKYKEQCRAEGINISKVIELMHNAAVGMYDTKEEMLEAIASARRDGK